MTMTLGSLAAGEVAAHVIEAAVWVDLVPVFDLPESLAPCAPPSERHSFSARFHSGSRRFLDGDLQRLRRAARLLGRRLDQLGKVLLYGGVPPLPPPADFTGAPGDGRATPEDHP